ncbi:unnamed protein product [Rotaria magnacalcarata]|uniref:Reverse transcriptase domain-containing protein n=1 Tax=Rotaria magnacalcarata TaxID=392030 RepID=A0A816XEH3_9BILA|nr:unnamed protein product [Rotaria magnacalcarata]
MNYNNIVVATSEKEKANIFAEFFQSEIYAAPNNTLPFHDQVSKQVNIIRNRTQNTSDIKWKNITPEEVKWHMKQLRNSATDPDNIHNRYLKNYTSQLIDHLTLLFNSVVDDKHQPSSYRPISLLSCLGKLLERIIKQRLLLELNSRNILPQRQAGFRPKKSTMYNIVRIERYVKSQLHPSKIRRHTAAIFFDIKAAFDSVWQEGLIYKFNDLRLPIYIIKYLISFLESRTATVELDNTLSRLFTLSSGTPQGSPLSPLLYIIYTSDSMNGIPPHIEHGLVADDTALWTSSHQLTNLNDRLQQSINEFEKWCKAWKLKLQPTKTELVHFSIHPRKKYKNPVQVKVENITIQPETFTRYLGMIMDNRLSWRTHLKQVETRIAARLSLLRFLNRAAIEPNHNIMINLYKSLIRTVIIYGYPVLLCADNKIWDRIQIIQNKALRMALGLPHYTSVDYIHRIANIPRIKDYAVNLLERAASTAASSNEMIYHRSLQDILQASRTQHKSIYLRLHRREQLSPQVLLDDKFFRSAIRLQHRSTYHSQLQFVGILIIDNETQRLTYIIDHYNYRLQQFRQFQLNY